MKQAEKNLTIKAGEFGLELLGYYDAQRAFGEYDPITGEKVSVGERLLAFGMLALTLYPPAKVVGVGGKTQGRTCRFTNHCYNIIRWLFYVSYND